MNLSQVNNQDTKAKAQEPKEQKVQGDSPSLLDLVALSDTADAWFKKKVGASLDNVDVVRLDIREAQFNGQKCLTDDGKQIYEWMLTMLTPAGAKRYYSFRFFSNAFKSISKALNPTGKDGINFVRILGKNITLKIVDQKGNAYVHSCVINGDAKHKDQVDWVYGTDGNPAPEDEMKKYGLERG